jgi:hypothetical protein
VGRLNREEEIKNFCKDLGIVWAKYQPEATFGDLIEQIFDGMQMHGMRVWATNDADMIDIIREHLKFIAKGGEPYCEEG